MASCRVFGSVDFSFFTSVFGESKSSANSVIVVLHRYFYQGPQVLPPGSVHLDPYRHSHCYLQVNDEDS